MRKFKPFSTLALAAAIAISSGPALANRTSSLLKKVANEVSNQYSAKLPATGTIEVAFSPNQGAEALVVRLIDSAQQQIHVLAYSFTSAVVVDALLRAKHRGVDVKVVADHVSNVVEDKSGKGRAALNALQIAGVDTRTIRVYPIHHDKTILVDGLHTELGSFNYSAAAAKSNSENALVNWNNPELNRVYESHFQRNYYQSVPFAGR